MAAYPVEKLLKELVPHAVLLVPLLLRLPSSSCLLAGADNSRKERGRARVVDLHAFDLDEVEVRPGRVFIQPGDGAYVLRPCISGNPDRQVRIQEGQVG